MIAHQFVDMTLSGFLVVAVFVAFAIVAICFIWKIHFGDR